MESKSGKASEFVRYWAKRLTRKPYLHTGNIREYQIRRINNLISHARKNSPFYADLYGNLPADFRIKELPDMNALPVASKEAFRKACSSGLVLHKDVDKGRLICATTTGSTGTPSTVLFTEKSYKQRRRVTDRVFHNAGLRTYRRFCLIWRNREMSKGSRRRHNKGLFMNLAVGDATSPVQSALTQDKFAGLVRSLIEFNPQVIRGYVSALFTIADYMEKNGLTIQGLERVITSAEYLPSPVWDTLERVFKCPVINFYGSSEADSIACSSVSSRLMTISEDLYFAEVLDENNKPVKAGQQGLITLTNLTATAMPFIRFQIGDMAVVDEDFYNYGDKFRHFVSVEGRTNDVFELEDGSVIFSHLWHIIFRDQSWIETFQVIQKSTSRIEIKILCSQGNEQNLSSLVQTIRERFKGINFDFQVVDRIDAGPGGKFRAVMSEVPNKFNRINK